MNNTPQPISIWARIRDHWRRQWRSHLGTLVLTLAVFFGVQAWQTRGVAQGPLPELAFTLVSPDGRQQTTTLADWRAQHAGQAVALYLWAEWCPVCKLQQPSVTALAAKVPLLSIAMQSGPPQAVARVLAQRRLSWATAVDPRGSLSRALGFASVPAFVVIDAKGRLRTPTVGYTSELGMHWRLWWANIF